MKAGVGTAPCGVIISPRRALPSVASSRKENLSDIVPICRPLSESRFPLCGIMLRGEPTRIDGGVHACSGHAATGRMAVLGGGARLDRRRDGCACTGFEGEAWAARRPAAAIACLPARSCCAGLLGAQPVLCPADDGQCVLARFA